MEMTKEQREALGILFSTDNKVLEGSKVYGRIFYEILCKTESKEYEAEVKGWINYLEENDFEVDCWGIPDMRHDLYVIYK
ncbi:MAG: hypothetical protein ACRDDY_10375 [Clostridium sp.]|uniref:hypothetical protein n=1 Tax=Clostridium sp. TaxID=1506 RepID=UPI003EE7E8D3